MLGLIVSLGISVFFTIELVRKLPGIQTWALAGKRPWGCDLCMSFWSAVTWSLATAFIGDVPWEMLVWTIPGSGGVSLTLLYWTASMMPPLPPQLD